MKFGTLVAAFSVAAIACAVIAFAAVGAVDLHAWIPGSDSVGTSLAMTIMPAFNQRARGHVGVRADGTNAAAILAELKQTFEAFKTEREAELKGINAKFADVVQTEKVDRINAEVTKLQKALDDVNATMAAIRIGGAGGDVDPDVAEHAQAFNRWFRKGVDAGLSDLEVKAKLTTQSDPDGGYLVPEEMESTIDRIVGTVSAVRSMSRVIQISTDTYKKLVNMGGATSGWVGEEQARTDTNTPTLRELAVNTGEIYAQPAATQKMLDDGRIDIAAWLGDEVSIEFAEKEGAAFVSGNGVNKPRGILAYDTVANASYEWGKLGYVKTGAAAAFAGTDPADALISLYYALKQQYRNGASWLLSDAVMETVRKFKDGQGNYLWAPPSGPAMVSTILGKPVATDDNMPALGANAFPVAFGNFTRGYLIVDRTGIRVLRDPYTSKPNVLFYTTKRVGGGVVNFEALKLLKCEA
ncbi:phage major capsid protein [Sinorhizobium meliloti]|uniref:phage major capsid protein n=1 Tax=Rhizobium meliloti TaxID=382 RepID=UPI000B498CFF|nr:phage major capsid protein [Sinorhizobium meliloti]ASQ10648.1 phage major capsid protein [Sinorhizobium meliloti]MQU81519.1 phage major capsid protein [Sinorhizobium meliloti]MQU87253.1 phage major capsid protein [Sinorhizobium meliloti]